MAKITESTAKAGQKCVLTIKTDLYYQYDKQDGSLSDNNLNGWNWINSWNPELTGSCVENKTRMLLHISPTKMKEIKEMIKESGVGQLKVIKTLDKDTEVEIVRVSSWSEKGLIEGVCFDYDNKLILRVISGEHEGLEFVSMIKSIKGRLDTAHFEDFYAEKNAKTKYKIFYKDKPYKTKLFGDISKVKASLMDAIGYNGKVLKLNQHYQELSPEVGSGLDYWHEGYESLYRKDMKDIKVYEWANRKKGEEADFDALKYYDSLMDYMKVTAQFGSAVRQLYKTHKDSGDFTTIVCFMHEYYRNQNRSNWDYHTLTESQIIKDAMKLSKVKGTKKCSKNGKTAIIFKSESDAMNLLRHLEKGTYFVLDMNGSELVEQSAHFIQNTARMKKLERILIEEFEKDFEKMEVV